VKWVTLARKAGLIWFFLQPHPDLHVRLAIYRTVPEHEATSQANIARKMAEEIGSGDDHNTGFRSWLASDDRNSHSYHALYSDVLNWAEGAAYRELFANSLWTYSREASLKLHQACKDGAAEYDALVCSPQPKYHYPVNHLASEATPPGADQHDRRRS
jgi:hypothetical protein